MVEFVVTSNHDNLHVKSGLPLNRIAELYGNAYREKCLECQTEFRRATTFPPFDRRCENCNGKLKKTGCRYGQLVPKEPLHAALAALEIAECALVLGSGMHSWPFDITHDVAKSYIVNLGPTAKDGDCTRKFDVSCDEFMHALCKALNVHVPNTLFEQKFRISRSVTSLVVRGYNERECCTFASRASLSIYNGSNSDDDSDDKPTSVIEIERNLKWEFVFDLPPQNTYTRLVLRLYPHECYNAHHMKFAIDHDETIGTFRTEIQ